MKKNVLLIVFIFIVIFSVIIIKPINDLDEIWNYNTARAISDGLIPYKDISMITTPLLPMVTAVFLKLILNEIIISRILAVLIWSGILFLIYKILKLLIKEEYFCLISTALIGVLCRNIYCIDYNVTVLFIALIILYRELKDKSEYNLRNSFIIGILAGLAICTKQSIGITLAGVTVIYKVLFVENVEQLRKYIKLAFVRIIGILIPVMILFIYLIFTGAINEFINYAILGISTFSNKISYIGLLENDNIEIRILSILVPISIILIATILLITKILKKDNEKIKNILTLFIYSFSIIIVMYPISDAIHFLIGSLIAIVGLIYLLGLLGEKIYFKVKYDKKYRVYKIIALILWIILFSIISTKGIENLYKYWNVEKNTEIAHYKNIEIGIHLKDRIFEINNYILKKEAEGKKVYILDAEAAIHMLSLDKYNKDYDMFLKGNIGKDGEDGQIQKIKQRDKDALYLIRNEKLRTNWQTPLNVINYIRNNLNKIDDIEIYEVYQ